MIGSGQKDVREHCNCSAGSLPVSAAWQDPHLCAHHVFQAAISALCLFLQFAACLNVAVPSLNFVARQLARINLRFAKGSWQGRCSNIQLKQARMITKYLITSWMSDLRP